MAKLTKEQAKRHRQADALTRLGRDLTEDARAFVLEHWAEGAAAVAAGRTAQHDENTPASPVEAEPSEADARDRAADLADMVAEAEVRARVQTEIDHEGTREIIRHVFCGPDPRIIARWEAERAEELRDGARRDSSADPEPVIGPAHEAQMAIGGQCLDRVPAGDPPHSGAAHNAPAGGHGDRLRMRPNVHLQRPLRRIRSSAKPRPGCTAPPIGHPRAESSATRARLPPEVDHGLHGRWPMADEERPAGGRFRVASALTGPLHRRWPMADIPASAIGHGRRWPVSHGGAVCSARPGGRCAAAL